MVTSTRSLYRSVDLRYAADENTTGLSLWTTVPTAILITAVAGLLSAGTGKTVFDIGFGIAWVLAGLMTRRRQIGALLIWTPIVFAGTAVVAELRLATFDGDTLSLGNLAILMFKRVVFEAPPLFITVAILLVLRFVRRPR